MHDMIWYDMQMVCHVMCSIYGVIWYGMIAHTASIYKVELAWLQGDAYAAIGDRLDQNIVDMFPTETKEVTMNQVENKLKALSESQLYKVASRESQSTVDAMLQTLNKMILGGPPPDSMKTAGPVYTKCWARMEYFVRHESPGGKMVFGTEALKGKLIALKAMYAKEERVAKIWELDLFKAAVYAIPCHYYHASTTMPPLPCYATTTMHAMPCHSYHAMPLLPFISIPCHYYHATPWRTMPLTHATPYYSLMPCHTTHATPC